MRTITKKVNIKAPQQKVWGVLADFGNVSNTSPNIKKSYLTSIQQNGVGATRHCDLTSFGATIEERITEWREGENLKVDIYSWTRIPAIKTMKAEFQISSQNDGTTTLVASIIYDLKYGLVGNLLDKMMIKPQNDKSWRIFLASIKYHVETGQKVELKTKIDKSPVTSMN